MNRMDRNGHGSGKASETDIQAVRRTAEILDLFSVHRSRVTAQQAALLLDLNRTTAHRYLVSMEKAGLVQRHGSEYSVGRLVVQAASTHLGCIQLMRAAPAHMRILADHAELTCALSLWGRAGPVVVHVAEDHGHELVLTVPIGTQLNIFSAHAQVWLAFGHDQLAGQRLIAMLPPAQCSELTQRVEETRSSGLGLNVTSGYVAVAAPIHADSEVQGVVAVLGGSALLPPTRESSQAKALQDCVERISADMALWRDTTA